MAHDLIIRGGDIVDGTGSAAVRADVAVDSGRIARIGDLSEVAASTDIDATGKLVTPGFVDVHTHLDAQIGWDPAMQSSCYHGVTTVLMGNCGVTFAPAAAENRRYLAELMESVEDISADAIMDGLPWSWSTYGEYLDAVQQLEPALNVVGMVGHSTIGFDAMGDRSMDEGAQPTDDELRVIADHVRQSLDDGAVGFSTSRFLGHTVPDGRKTPGTYADMREIEAIQRAIVEGGGVGAVFQSAPDMFSRREIELEMFELGAELGCQVVFSGGVGRKGDGGVGFFDEFLGRHNAQGRRITTIAHTRPSGALFGLAQLSPFRTPAWQKLMSLPTIDDRITAIEDPTTRDELMAEAFEAGMRIPAEMLHPMGTDTKPTYDLDDVASLAHLSDATGRQAAEVWVERLFESGGRELTNMWMFGANLGPQWKYQSMDHCIPLLGDAGAHVGQLIDADSTTFLLSELTHDRGLFTLEDAIHRMTAKPAQMLGLGERGEVREGWHADLNVIDYANLSTRQPEYVHDFPFGGGRFIVRSDGYDATIVGGHIVTRHGESTGTRPGRVVREFSRG